MKNMKKTLFVFLILFLTTVGFAEQPVLVKEFVGQIVYVQGKVLQLAEAVPQSAYEWRPEEGVRSVSEVYLHFAFANYLTVTITGGTVPKETGFEMDFSKAHAWDTQTTDKTEIMEKVSESFETLKERVGMLTEEDLNREVEVFGMTMTIRNFMITMIGHTHEHLGQSIAYARTNHVTPPWSKKDSEG
ncbi:MAG: DinB family protein [Ignavibacteriaceae bacterium]|jgi:uncharacterized damage-inducible protein DinB|nr:DinB family protein [Ignavibacteriaceae bacterium]MCW9065384.1 DinB family protein [Ignavibacteriaceae bacterium]